MADLREVWEDEPFSTSSKSGGGIGKIPDNADEDIEDIMNMYGGPLLTPLSSPSKTQNKKETQQKKGDKVLSSSSKASSNASSKSHQSSSYLASAIDQIANPSPPSASILPIGPSLAPPSKSKTVPFGGKATSASSGGAGSAIDSTTGFPANALSNASLNASTSVPALLPTQDHFLGYEDPHSFASQPALIVPPCAAGAAGPGEVCRAAAASPAPPVPPYASALLEDQQRARDLDEQYRQRRMLEHRVKKEHREKRRQERARKLAEEARLAEQERDDYGMCFRPRKRGPRLSTDALDDEEDQDEDNNTYEGGEEGAAEAEEEGGDGDVMTVGAGRRSAASAAATPEEDEGALDTDESSARLTKKKTRKEGVVPYIAMPYSNIVEIALYIITGILLIFVLEQFIQIGVRIGAASVFRAPPY